jgi:hypothetical protein
MPKNDYIRREIEERLFGERGRDVISVVIGPRQVGKTTLFSRLVKRLCESGVAESNIVFLNFDDIELRSRMAENPATFIHELEIRFGMPLGALRERVYVFLDEAQKVPLLFDMIKLVFDTHKRKVKLFISGSSSLEIQKQAAETLAGRLRYHYLFPLTLKEIICYYGLWKGEVSPLELIIDGKITVQDFGDIQASIWENRREIENLKEKISLFGSLPGVFLELSEEERWYMLRDYAATYIEKDIRLINHIGNLDLFHRVYKALLLQHSQLLNVSNLSKDIGISRNTLNSYLNVLEQTQVIHRVTPFVKRPKARIMKAPKIYFFDSGIVNHGTRQTSLEALQASNREGLIEEGILLSQLLSITKERSIPPEIYYLRDHRGHEIDFVLDNKELVGIEITTERQIRRKKYININYFSQTLGIYKVIVIGKFNEISQKEIGKTKVILFPSWMAW